jgi:hypothetical protein
MARLTRDEPFDPKKETDYEEKGNPPPPPRESGPDKQG